MEILYKANDMHNAIKRVLGNPVAGERRVAIVAYVGKLAKNFIPNPKDLKIVCALQPGATCPSALDELKKSGATILKADRLHMKVYWSSEKGCVIGSANLSGNALGANGLKEAGIFLPQGKVDIEKFIAEVQPSEITDHDLKKLRKETDSLDVQIRSNPTYEKRKRTPIKFDEWYEQQGRIDWKIGWWAGNSSEDWSVSKAAKKESIKMYGCEVPNDSIYFAKDEAAKGDWVLTFKLPNGDKLDWMYVDFVVKVAKNDKESYEKEYPFEAVQVHKKERYPTPPFKFQNDSVFREAFKKACKEFGGDDLEGAKGAIPPESWLKMIYDNYNNLSKK